ncbi:ferritin-like domain-containing protein [Lysobacter sp. HA18]
MHADLHDAAHACLRAATPEDKVARSFETFERFSRGELAPRADSPAPRPVEMPGRPERPRLVSARDLPKRGFGTNEGLAAFVHAIAHIEFNAIDLAWDAVYRYRAMPAQFYADWASVANDEARHFTMLRGRLRDLGCDYGDFDAHNGLWEMAEKTAHDGLARMALVPRVLEARGLDVTPGMIVKLRQRGDDATADILDVILREEVGHVAAGSRWFRWHCVQRGLEPQPTFKALLAEYARAVLYGPFNREARLEAGFDAEELASLESLAN